MNFVGRLIIYFILILPITSYAQAPPWQWVKQASTASVELAYEIAYDATTNTTYVCGTFAGDLSSSYGDSLKNTYGGADAFVARYDANGNVLSAFKIGGDEDDVAIEITTDDVGNVYITGAFRGTANFKGLGGPDYFLTCAGGSRDVFIAKYNSSGILQWVVQGISNYGIGYSVVVNGSDVYVCGTFWGGLSFQGQTLSSLGSSDCYMLKINSSGTVDWLRSVGSGDEEDETWVLTAYEDNVYIVGNYRSETISFNGTTFELTNNDDEFTQIYLASYTNEGTFRWAKSIGRNGNKNDEAFAIAANSDGVYISGYIYDKAKFPGHPDVNGLSEEDFFLSKHALDNGNTDWVVTAKSNNLGWGYDIDLAPDGKIYVIGDYIGNTNFSGTILSGTGGSNRDIFVACYNPDRTLNWVKGAAGGGREEGYGISVGADDNIYVCGAFSSDISFDSIDFNSSNNYNIFAGRIGECTPITDNTISADQTICSGNTPAPLTGTSPTGGDGNYVYNWQQSPDNINYSTAVGTSNNSDYAPGVLTDTTYYRRIVTSSTCDTSFSDTVQISVQPPITGNTISADQTICSGHTPSALSGSDPIGGDGSHAFLWQQSLDNINYSTAVGTSNNSDYAPGVLTDTTYYRRIVTSSTCDTSFSDTVQISVQPPITGNTISADQTICSGHTPSALSGSDPIGGDGSHAFLWQQSLDNINYSTAVGTSNNSDYAPGILTDTTYYRRIVTSSTCDTSFSDTVQISVQPPITGNTISADQTICSGHTPSVLTGTSPTGGDGSHAFLWQQSLDNINYITAIGTSTNTDYAPGVLTDTTYYRRIVTSSTCDTSFSDTVQISVQPPITGNTISADQTICSGHTPSALSGSDPIGGDGSHAFLWQQSLDNINYSTAVGTSNNSDYAPDILTDTTYYRRIVTSSTCDTSFSDTVQISVQPPITGNTISADQTICSGHTPSVLTGTSPTGGDGSHAFLWQQSLDNINYITAIGTSTNTDYVPGILTDTTYYRRIVTSSTCDTSFSDTVQISVQPPITGNTISADQTICSDLSPDTLRGSSPAGGDNAFTYLWQASADGITFYSATGSNDQEDYHPGTLSDTTSFRRIVYSSTCDSSISNLITINVYPSLTNNIISADQTICSGIMPDTFLGNKPSGGNGQIVWMWEIDSNDTGFADITFNNTDQNYLPPITMTDSLITKYYRRVATSGNCLTSYSNTVQLITTATISDNTISGNDTLCSEDSALVLSGSLPMGGDSNYIYSWEFGITPTNFTAAPGADSLQHYITNSIDETTYFRRIVRSINCPQNTSDTAVIVVYLPITNNTIEGPDELCKGTSNTLYDGSTGSGGDNSYSYQWEKSSDGINFESALGSSRDQFYNLPVISNPIHLRRKITSSVCDTSISTELYISVNDNPNADFEGNDSICQGDSILLSSNNISGLAPFNIQYATGDNIFNFEEIEADTHSFTVIPAQSKIYTIKELEDANGCISKNLTDSFRVTVLENPVANAGEDKDICGLATQLEPFPSVGMSTWQIPDEVNYDSTDYNVIANQYTTYNFVWTENNVFCADSDSVTISFHEQPNEVDAGMDKTLYYLFETDVIANTPENPFEGHWEIIEGSAELLNIYEPNLQVINLSVGVNIFRWIIENGPCEVIFDDVEVLVEDLYIPEGFSPNFDQINDNFVVRGLENVPSANLQIFNRWGHLVYETDQYLGTWDGTNMNGKKIAPDTYHYILKVSELDLIYNGYVVVKY